VWPKRTINRLEQSPPGLIGPVSGEAVLAKTLSMSRPTMSFRWRGFEIEYALLVVATSNKCDVVEGWKVLGQVYLPGALVEARAFSPDKKCAASHRPLALYQGGVSCAGCRGGWNGRRGTRSSAGDEYSSGSAAP
jgi:hypothetical protein